MKNNNIISHKTIVRILLLTTIFCIFILIFNGFKSENNYKHCTINTPGDTLLINKSKRESITFILGEDKEADNPYYSKAEEYYRYNKTGKTEYVIIECRSLYEVHKYLAENPSSAKIPWSKINIVSHGNQWLGLSVKVAPNSKRSTTKNIMTYVDSGYFEPLPETIIDKETEILVHGCGVGNNPSLIKAISKVFRSNKETPMVRASKLFEYYASIKSDNFETTTEHYLAETWFSVYKYGYRPSDNKLTKELKEKYPDSSINWKEAINREQPRWNGDIYHYTFDIPLKWIIKYSESDSMPDLSNKKNQIEWIKNQSEITEILNQIEIPAEKFNWWFRTVYVNNDDGTRSSAIWIKGYSTIICVIKPLIKTENKDNPETIPLNSDYNNNKYYYSYLEL